MSDFKCIPPNPKTRNEHGLLTDVNYVFTADGYVDWRKMVKPEFLYVNTERFKQRDLPVPPSIDGVADDDLVIRLGGIKELAQLRGYRSVAYNFGPASEKFVSVSCVIYWIGNFETDGKPTSFSDGADAHGLNTSGFGFNYLTTTAINRAFVRTVRNFLKIAIVGQEELSSVENSTSAPVVQSSSDAGGALMEALRAKGKTFEQLKARMVKEGIEGAADFAEPNDIPKLQIFNLIEKINSNAKSLRD